MARQFRSRGALQAPKRQIANDVLQGFAQLTFGATTGAKAVGSFGFALLVPAATLVRTRGSFTASVVTSGTAASHKLITMGLTVVSIDAFNAGLNSLPTPIDEGERMWQTWAAVTPYADAATPAEGAFGQVQSFDLDSRGMRKLKVGDVLAIMFEGLQLSATTGTLVNVSYNLRFQFKL